MGNINLYNTIPANQFGVGADHCNNKKIKLDPNSQHPQTTVTLKSNANTTTDIIVTLPATSGTLSYGGTPTNSFTTIQTPVGTSPVATSPTDTLTLSTSGGEIVITGNSSTDTVQFNLGTTGVTAATYRAPTFSADSKGRIVTSITNCLPPLVTNYNASGSGTHFLTGAPRYIVVSLVGAGGGGSGSGNGPGDGNDGEATTFGSNLTAGGGTKGTGTTGGSGGTNTIGGGIVPIDVSGQDGQNGVTSSSGNEDLGSGSGGSSFYGGGGPGIRGAFSGKNGVANSGSGGSGGGAETGVSNQTWGAGGGGGGYICAIITTPLDTELSFEYVVGRGGDGGGAGSSGGYAGGSGADGFIQVIEYYQ